MSLSFIKEYVDYGVQTTFSPPSSPRSVTPDRLNLDSQSSDIQNDLSPPATCLIECEDAYDVSFTSYSSSPVQSITTTTRRVMKTQQLPVHRPSQIPQSDTQRVVSLPETTSLYSEKSQLESVAKRIVSMPEHLKSLVHTKEFKIYSSDYNDISAHSAESYASGGNNRSLSTRTPRTPSPPSSPESVVIIENKFQLSETFLRNHSVDLISKGIDREGWVTWAKSPPRPIPALHGPLSLPYARCPSGAEGTVIDEQENLPRMIWGLGVDRPSGAGEIPHPANYKESAHHQKIPPRLQTQDNSEFHPLLASLPLKTSTEAEGDHFRQVIHQTTLDREFEYPSQFNETIDLSRLLAQSHLQDTSNSLHSVAFNDASPVNRTRDEKPVYNRSDNRHNNWKSFVTHDRTRLSAVTQTTNSAAPVVHPKPLVSTHPAPGSTRPVILLDSHSHSVSLPPPRRLSAIEIAQKFRQQQELLPTPPSTQWSSDFSPYQESMLSPEAVFLSSLSPDLQLGIAQHLQRSAYESVANSSNEVHLAPAPHIRSDVTDQTCENYSQGLQRHSRSHHLFPHNQNISTPYTANTVHCLRPPNASLSAVSRIGTDQRRVQPNIDANLTSSIQQPRSIPLSRLVQRRLSSVMETPEDHVERSPSPPVFQQNFHLSRAVEPEIRATPTYTDDSSHGRSAVFMTEKDIRRGNGDEPRRLSAFEQIKAQLYGAEFIDVRKDGRQVDGCHRTEHKDNRGLDINRDNGGGKARHVGFKPQAPFKRKMRGKKKNGSAGENAPIAN